MAFTVPWNVRKVEVWTLQSKPATPSRPMLSRSLLMIYKNSEVPFGCRKKKGGNDWQPMPQLLQTQASYNSIQSCFLGAPNLCDWIFPTSLISQVKRCSLLVCSGASNLIKKQSGRCSRCELFLGGCVYSLFTHCSLVYVSIFNCVH